MSLTSRIVHRYVPDDSAHRTSLIRQSEAQLAEAKAAVGELIPLTELIRAANAKNHFSDKIRSAYGKG